MSRCRLAEEISGSGQREYNSHRTVVINVFCNIQNIFKLTRLRHFTRRTKSRMARSTAIIVMSGITPTFLLVTLQRQSLALVMLRTVPTTFRQPPAGETTHSSNHRACTGAKRETHMRKQHKLCNKNTTGMLQHSSPANIPPPPCWALRNHTSNRLAKA